MKKLRYALSGMFLGVILGPLIMMLLFQLLSPPSGNHMDGTGLAALFLGAWGGLPGLIVGWKLGEYVERRPKR